MLVYLYDASGIFTQPYICQADPLSDGEWVVPTQSTVVPVPELSVGETALYHFDTAEWEVIPAVIPPTPPFDLTAAQATKQSEVLLWRTTAMAVPVVVTVGGSSHTWQADPISQNLLSGVLNGVTVGYATAPPYWRSSDNINVSVTIDDLKAIASAISTQVATAMYHSFSLSDAVAAATSQADLDAIVW